MSSSDNSHAAFSTSERQLRRIVCRHRQRERDHEEPAAADNQPGHIDDAADAVVDPDDLGGNNAADAGVAGELRGAVPCFVVENLLDWPAATRWNFFRFLQSVGGEFVIREAHGDERAFTDAFEFVLAQMCDDHDVARCQAGRDAAVEAAAVFYPRALDAACNRIAGRLRELGVRGVRVESIRRDARSLREAQENATALERPVVVADVLPDLRAATELVVPPPWSLSPEVIANGGRQVLSTPVLITARLIAADDAEMVEICFLRRGVWHRREVPRVQIVTPRGVVKLAEFGLPINATNARALVEFFAAFEQANENILPVRRLVDRMGWHRVDGDQHFVLGREIVSSNDVEGDNSATGEEQVRGPGIPVVFRPRTGGDREIADAVHQAGNYAAWLEAIAAIAPFPKLKLAFYAALTPPLLRMLGAPSFCLDFAGPTSCGKTTALRVAAAVWGCPDERRGSLILNWDSTPAFRQRAAHTLGSLPLIIDETRLAGSDDEVIRAVYSVIGNGGRGRCGPGGGTQRTDNWATVLIVSGETPVAAMTNKGGAIARTFSLWGSPFGRVDQTTAALARQLNRDLASHYGFAGPELVRYLARFHGMWSTWREEYFDRVAQLEHRAGDNAVACRMASALATVSITARLVHEALDLPWRRADPVDELGVALIAHAADADFATRALEAAVDWARGNRHRFFEIDRPSQRHQNRSWAGRWDQGGAYLGIRPPVLKRVLREAGFDFEATIRTWRGRDWLVTDRSSGKSTYRAVVGRDRPWLVAIRQAAIEEIEGGDEGDDE